MTNLPKEIFGLEMNENVIHQALVWYQASRRRGTHSTKTRAEVRGGGKKPWRQKGTGRARAGSIRSPLWKKGGVIFGPKPRSYAYNLPKKVRKLAIRIALSDKAKAEQIKVVAELKVAEPKTKLVTKLLKDLGVTGKGLIVQGKEDEIFVKAARNIKGVSLTLAKDINIYDVLNAQWILVDKSAIVELGEVLA